MLALQIGEDQIVGALAATQLLQRLFQEGREWHQPALPVLRCAEHDLAFDLDRRSLHLNSVSREDDVAHVHADRFAPPEAAVREQKDQRPMRVVVGRLGEANDLAVGQVATRLLGLFRGQILSAASDVSRDASVAHSCVKDAGEHAERAIDDACRPGACAGLRALRPRRRRGALRQLSDPLLHVRRANVSDPNVAPAGEDIHPPRRVQGAERGSLECVLLVAQPLDAQRSDSDTRLTGVGIGAVRARDLGVREVELGVLLGAEALLLDLLLLVIAPAHAVALARRDLVRRDASHG